MMTPLIAFGSLGWPEILLIFLVVLVLFGAKRLPELARGLGRSLSEFRKAKDEFDQEIRKSAQELQSEKPAETHPSKQA
ncbi:MAG TPA: twin-arginine translocase TatA/TatE family subunit [Chthoniobacterales bacterium]